MKPTPYLMRIRSELFIDPIARTSFEVSVAENGVTYAAHLLCATCGTTLDWSDSSKWWSCGICSSELTRAEAIQVLAEIQKSVNELQRKMQTGERKWRWVRWFMRFAGKRA
jgi:ribosomal protein L37AE/L43A